MFFNLSLGYRKDYFRIQLKKFFKMDRIKFEFDGRLEGGFPLEEEDIRTITELDFMIK